jgi:hypothetical protein
MSKKFTLNQLTEGIRQRDVGQQNAVLTEKWSRTGLLRGLGDTGSENMARLLENQAAQLLREQSSIGGGAAGTTSSGDLRGFTNIAFPIVRRVFGGLVANELVSIQPMSLPSGLLFYLDYTYGSNVGLDSDRTNGAAGTSGMQTYTRGQSIYNLPTGKGVRSGSDAVGGQYDLAGTGYSRVHTQLGTAAGDRLELLASGAFGPTGTSFSGGTSQHAVSTGSDGKLLQFDPQVSTLIDDNLSSAGQPGGKGLFQFLIFDLGDFPAQADLTAVKEIAIGNGGAVVGVNVVSDAGLKKLTSDTGIQGGGVLNIRRLNQIGTFNGGVFTPDPFVTRATTNAALLTVVSGTYLPRFHATNHGLTGSYVQAPTLNTGTDGSTLTIPTFESNFGATPSVNIPEIDIKIESIAVTAETRKLRARWSPELAQDLNAYHSLDAEVELTQILSEQIALELDREILNDLLTQAQGANYYWSRSPGKFVNKKTGGEVTLSSTLAAGPAFTGTVREWYETLVETIIDVANEIHRKTLRGSANFVVCSPDVATIFEASVLYKPNYSLDGQGQVGSPFQLGAAPIGSLSNRFTVYKDPYFPRNKVLVGYKGGSYLETGYVYAPYVPLIVTPTIFAPEDFTPRKGVMTRYGKRMVRADFYGTVTCLDMDVI